MLVPLKCFTKASTNIESRPGNGSAEKDLSKDDCYTVLWTNSGKSGDPVQGG